MATATKGDLMMIDQSHCFCAIIIHSPVEALEHRAARDSLRRVKLRPRRCCLLFSLLTWKLDQHHHHLLTTPYCNEALRY
jgi:hypothetical protein